MTFDPAQLSAPFPAAEIEWRVGSTNGDKTSGLALAYLTARHVMDRLDAVVGPSNWQDRYEFHGARTVCYLSLRIGDEWVTKADGAGDSDVEAEKGAISDALKRAAVKWGIGRYLYDLGNIWVDLEAAGRSVRIKRDQYAKLEGALMRQFGAGPAPLSHVEVPDAACLASIEKASSLDALQEAFKSAWRSTGSAEIQAAYKAAYESRKPQLGTPAVPPNFDDLPPETQQAIKVARV